MEAMMKNVLILFCLIWITAPAFGQNQADQDERDAYGALTIFYGGSGYDHLTSGDGSEVYASLRKADTIIRFSGYESPGVIKYLGFDLKLGFYLDLFDGKVVQNLQPALHNLDKQFERKMGGTLGSILGITLDFIYILPKRSNHPVIFDLGLEVTAPSYSSHHDVYLTHDPNRSPECATAVNDAILNPTLAMDAIKTNCEKIPYSPGDQPLQLNIGVDWIASPNIKLSALYMIPINYSFSPHKSIREQSLYIGLSYVK